jgi:putative membrane-bound dehydrogenase-like protein
MKRRERRAPAWWRCRATPFWTLGLLLPFSALGAQFKFANQTLTVPDGFTVELAAGPPLVERPVSASFDDQGRLYATDDSGSNEKPDKQLEAKPHRVVRLVDTDGDGRFDKATVFADKMMFPEGCLWFDGSVYVSGPPSIWKLTDTNDDGVADAREEWHQGKTLTGCANDLHGPYLGPDGWIYWCKGAFATQTYERPGKKPFVTRAAHIFRAPPDHSYLEPVLTGGMDNPVGVAFTAEGERILCGTFFITHEPGKRDGMIHAIYGGVYGKINDATDDHKKTGDLMPIMTHMGPAAPCSVLRYESRVFGDAYRNNLFLCSFNLHKVTRHVLVPDGATFRTEDSDFVTSDNPDFHPTDVVEDADGSLLVVDTGGWYKICCPTSQLSKPDVLGAIYRIRRVGAPKVDDPRGLKLAWTKMQAEDLAQRLGDPRPAVCKRAIAELAKVGSKAVAPVTRVLKSSGPLEAQRNAVWALTRIDAPEARQAVRTALADGSDESLRHVAIHSVSLWRDADALKALLTIVGSSGPHLQRVAAEALGRIGNKDAAPALLKAAAQKHDRVLEHSLIYALIEIAAPTETSAGLNAASPFEKRAAVIALDQMDGGILKPETVAPFLGASDPALRQTALWVASHHPDWGGALAGYFRERLDSKELVDADRRELEHQLAQFAGSEAIQQLIVSRLNEPTTPATTRELLLRSMALAAPKESPREWAGAVRSCLAQSDEALLRLAVSAARVLSQVRTNPPNFTEPLRRIARDETHPADLRLEALEALPRGVGSVEPGLLGFLCANVRPDKPVATRTAAATVLAKARLTDDQLLAFTDTLKGAGPLETTRLLAAYEHSTSEAVGVKLVASLKESKSLPGLRADVFKPLMAKYPVSVQEQGNQLLASLNADAAKQSAHLDELLPELKNGDIRRGQLVFNSQKAACASCHAMGYLGGKVGPDLTKIGEVRTERDLLESIVYPSASFVRSYEPFVVTTKSDETYSGVLKKDAPEEVVLATGPDTEVRLARSDITEMHPGTVSIMPAGLDQQLTKQELADLLAFLKATKWGPR